MLVNGSPKGFFKGSRGLRQGNVLFPYLFLLVVDLLGRLSDKAKDMGLLECFSLREGSHAIPFIQFADDSLFLLKVDVEGLRNLRCIFFIVEAVTGLKVNWSKSTLSPIGEVMEVEMMAEVLGCEVTPLPTSYLGLLLGANVSSPQSRIRCWKC